MTAGLEPDEGGATQAAADMPETLPSAGTFNFRWESSSAREVASATLVLTLGIVGK